MRQVRSRSSSPPDRKHLTLAVSDSSDVLPEEREAHVEGGRGMVVLAGLADRWGVRRRDGGGKTVWCEFRAVA